MIRHRMVASHYSCYILLGVMLSGVMLLAMARAQGERLEPPQLEEVFWQSARDGQVTVLTAHEADRRYLLEVFEIIAEAREDLRRWQLELPASQLVIHPDLSSYQVVTQQPWYVAATANRTESRIDMQRARVLVERGSLRLTLRHELFHLAQPEGLPRYVAEGLAMHFAGEHPQAPAWMGPLPQLERVLASPRDQQELTQAMARANAEVALALQRMPVSCLLFTDESCPQ